METVAALLMVKNEEKIISITLDSLKDFPVVLVYDTGSSDETISIAKSYKNVKIYNGIFEDFSTSRNRMLDIAEEHIDQEYLLLLDAGDQFVQTSDIVLDFNVDMYMVQFLYQSSYLNKYYNTRLIKNKKGYRYKGKVHEYICRPADAKVATIKSFHLYQDRNICGSSSLSRWPKDRVILEQEVSKDNPDPRDVFYLAQTYECLGEKELAYKTYKQRTKMTHGFYEERFISMVRCGDTANSWDKRLSWYIRAFDLINRVEPLVKIAEYYKDNKRFFEAWMFLKLACNLNYPENCILFVDDDAYSYKRYHLLGIVSYYIGKKEDGKLGCQLAIKAKNNPIDVNNLKYYQ